MVRNLKTVIFGGTFNPPHIGHQQMLDAVCIRGDVEKVLLIPTKAPVHKVGHDLVSGEHRLNMCKILAEANEKVEASNIELKRETKSYTYYTLLSLKEELKDAELWFLCGADMLLTIKTWFKFEELKKMCGFLAFFRKGEDKKQFLEIIEDLRNNGALVETIDVDIQNISSTDVRKAISKGKNIENMVGEKITNYINSNGLYRGTKDMTIEEYKNHIKPKLSEKRYNHSLCVAEEAVRLADRYGADKEKAFIAGLLHDTLKDTDDNEQLKLAKEFGIILSDLEISAPKLYHSLIGCEYVRNVLGVEDDEIIDSIRYHTTARANMTLLDKVIYLADYTSRDRNYPGVDEMRKAVDVSLEGAMMIALKFTVDELNAKGAKIHPNTLAAFEQYYNVSK